MESGKAMLLIVKYLYVQAQSNVYMDAVLVMQII